jgi:hypothetical protein
LTSVEQLVYDAVIQNAGITDLLATDTAGNVAFYLIQVPQQGFVYPLGVFQRISSPRLFVLQQVGNQASVGRVRFQFTFWGYDAGVLEQIDLALLAMFRTFDAYNAPSSPPTVVQPGFYQYGSRLLNEPQTQPVLQKLEVNVIFWFQDQ